MIKWYSSSTSKLQKVHTRSFLSFLAQPYCPVSILTLLHSERPKLFGVLAILHAVGLRLWSFGHSECNRVKTLWSFGRSECNRVKGHEEVKTVFKCKTSFKYLYV